MFSLTLTYVCIGCNDFCFLETLMKTIFLVLVCILLIVAPSSSTRAGKSGIRCLQWFNIGKLYDNKSLIWFCIYLYIISLNMILESVLITNIFVLVVHFFINKFNKQTDKQKTEHKGSFSHCAWSACTAYQLNQVIKLMVFLSLPWLIDVLLCLRNLC